MKLHPKVYLVERSRPGAWRRRRRRTVVAGTTVALFMLAMFVTALTWPPVAMLTFAASVGAIAGAHHWDKYRRPDPDDIDVISCTIGVFMAGACVAAVTAVIMMTAVELLA